MQTQGENRFKFYMPVKIHFGEGELGNIGEIAAKYGRKAMLVTTPWIEAQRPVFERIIQLVRESGTDVVLFDKVCPNPLATILDEGASLARREQVDVVIGVGGGSSLDAAKAIAVGATHPGSVWDYIFTSPTQPTEKTLPIIAITTTAGTGAHITQGAVISNDKLRQKSGIAGVPLFPKECIVDPELTYTLPERLTISTGFDAFTHAFECYIHRNHNILIDLLTLQAIEIIVATLPKLVADSTDRRSRVMMAYADTLSGIANANVGTTLFHAVGQSISGRHQHVSHGEALALVYPEIIDFTWEHCIDRFAVIAGIFDPQLATVSEAEAARNLGKCMRDFLRKIKLIYKFADYGISEDDLAAIAQASMGYNGAKMHPISPTEKEVREILNNSLISTRAK